MKWIYRGRGGSKIDGSGGVGLIPKHGARRLRERMAAGKIGHSSIKKRRIYPKEANVNESTLPKAGLTPFTI